MTLLTTARLALRPWTLSAGDVAAAFAVFGDPEVTRFLSRREPDLESQRRALALLIGRTRGLAPGLGWFALERRADAVVVGCAALVPLEQPEPYGAGGEPVRDPEIELGWHLARAHWGQGYATEAAAALVAHGLGNLALERVVAVVDPRNRRSLAVVARLGMRPAGRHDRGGRAGRRFVVERAPPAG